MNQPKTVQNNTIIIVSSIIVFFIFIIRYYYHHNRNNIPSTPLPIQTSIQRPLHNIENSQTPMAVIRPVQPTVAQFDALPAYSAPIQQLPIQEDSLTACELPPPKKNEQENDQDDVIKTAEYEQDGFIQEVVPSSLHINDPVVVDSNIGFSSQFQAPKPPQFEAYKSYYD